MTAVDIIGLALAAGSLGYGVVQGERGASQQRAGVRRQQTAQEQAAAQAARAQREAQKQVAEARRRTPDPDAILMSEYELGRRQGGQTLLTGTQPEEQRRQGPTLFGQ